MDTKRVESAIDRKCHQKNLITESNKNKIIATILEETSGFTKSSNIVFIPLHFNIVKESQALISLLHISADDDMQVYTAYTERCNYLFAMIKPGTANQKSYTRHENYKYSG